MSAPLVTVCVPTIGRPYLATCFESIRRQTYQNLEVLILDNASALQPDADWRRLAAQLGNARVLRVETRIPMFANFNRGIAAATGKYMTFFHDDDVYRERFIERHVEALERYPSAGFAGSNYDVIDGNDRVIRQNRLIRATGLVPGRTFARELLRRGRGSISTPGIVFRTEVMAEFPFDQAIPVNWGDFTIFLRMVEAWDVALLQENLYSWRVHGENGSNMPFHTAIPLRTQVLSDYCKEFRTRHPRELAFANELSRLVRRSHRRGLLWGWLAAEREVDANECRRMLATVSATTAAALRIAEVAGLDLAARRRIWPAIRRLGAVLGA